jgi:preprotein translocase subunit SecG
LMFLTATFLILLVLVQRGRGGGLAGALGGMGGQSAFGTKAGDMFTRITIGVAAVWIVLSCFAVWYFSNTGNEFGGAALGGNAPQAQTVAGTPGTAEGKAAPAATPEKKPATPETKGAETKAPESKAPESKAPETKAPETKAAAPETKAAAPATKAAAPATAAPASTTPATKSAAPADVKTEPAKK